MATKAEQRDEFITELQERLRAVGGENGVPAEEFAKIAEEAAEALGAEREKYKKAVGELKDATQRAPERITQQPSAQPAAQPVIQQAEQPNGLEQRIEAMFAHFVKENTQLSATVQQMQQARMDEHIIASLEQAGIPRGHTTTALEVVRNNKEFLQAGDDGTISVNTAELFKERPELAPRGDDGVFLGGNGTPDNSSFFDDIEKNALKAYDDFAQMTAANG